MDRKQAGIERKGAHWGGLSAGIYGGWLFLFAVACLAQTPTNSVPPPSTKEATQKSPSPPVPSGTGPAQNVPTLQGNAVLPVVLNYTFWNNSLMLTDAQINGHLERCIVDTGLNACAITPEAVTRLKATPLATQSAIATLNETRTASETEFKNFQFNQLKFDSMRAVVVNASELYTSAPVPDGPSLWLGTPFLAAFQATFDYTGHYIALDRVDAPLPKAKGLVNLPLEVREGRLYTRVSIPKAGAFAAFLNTGTMGTLIPASIAAKLKLKPTKTFDIKWTGGKKARASLITLPELQAGRVSQQQVPALYFESDGDAEVDRTLGVLGADFLRHYKIILNIAHKRLTLIPPPPPVSAENVDAPDTNPAKTPPKVKPKK